MTLLVDRCVTHAGPEARRRGWEQVTEGQVDLRSVAGQIARLDVRDGPRAHRVEIDWRSLEADRIGVRCTCVDFGHGVCCHLWAALLSLDARDVRVPGDGPLALVPLTGALPSTPPRPSPTSRWRQHLDDIVQRAPLASAPSGPGWRQAWLIVEPEASRERGAPRVDFYCRERRQTGGWGKLKPVTLDPDRGLDAYNAADRHLLERLLSFAERGEPWPYTRRPRARGVVLPADLLGWLLPPLCASGRFGWLVDDGVERCCRPIAWDEGAPWRLTLVGERTADSALHLSGRLRRPSPEGGEEMALDDVILALGSGFVLTRDRAARFRATEGIAWLPTLSEVAIEIPANEVGAALDAIARLRQLPDLDLPDLDEWTLARHSTPTPRLSVGFEARARELLATVDFVYAESPSVADAGEPMVVRADDPRSVVFDAEGRRLVWRDPVEEQRRFDELTADVADGAGAEVRIPRRRFVQLAERLLAADWQLLAAGRPMRVDGRFRARVHHRVDWFELDGGVDYEVAGGGTARLELPALLRAARDRRTLVELGDGSVAMLPEAWLERFSPWVALADPDAKGTAVRFGRNQALVLDALLAEEPTVEGDASFTAVLDRLRRSDGVEALDEPAGFVGTLRGYQRDGLGWLVWCQQVGLGGCLADDMGLGKTIQVLAFFARRRAADAASGRPSLLVVPRSLLHNWRDEAKRFVPGLRLVLYHGIGRDKLLDTIDDHIAMTTYGTLRQDIVALRELDFDLVVLDEAQAIKNSDSQTAKAARLLRARHRLALTGTPIENHLGELWSIFDFLNPGMLGRLPALDREAGRIEPDGAAVQAASRALRPLILRRAKEQVLADLPAKNEQTIACDLGAEQRRDYDALRDHYRAAIGENVERVGFERSTLQVLEALLRLRQAACHPGLIDPKREAEPSAKLDVLLARLAELVDEGHKALVFSQFTRFLGIVRQRLDQAGLPYAYLDGRTRQRQERVKRFQNDPDCPLFLVSLKAGGTGLNLTAASYVFLLDPWWNPAVEAQAIDRSHRIGQDRPVFAYRLIARDTVEEKILQLQASKRQLADAIVARDGRGLRDLTLDDLALLLG